MVAGNAYLAESTEENSGHTEFYWKVLVMSKVRSSHSPIEKIVYRTMARLFPKTYNRFSKDSVERAKRLFAFLVSENMEPKVRDHIITWLSSDTQLALMDEPSTSEIQTRTVVTSVTHSKKHGVKVTSIQVPLKENLLNTSLVMLQKK